MLRLVIYTKGELHLNAIFPVTWHGYFNENISLPFQAIQKTLSTYRESVLWDINWILRWFGGIFGRSSFSRKIGNIKRNKKYWRFSEVLKLEFVVNN